jgi:DNA polymerase-3 subunit gamma/tau
LEQAVYAPSNARFKVYMIDEVHMLTNHAFNSMLKTLEEPPEHIKFILATTDPQKIPVTVLSRCLQFNLKQMPPGHIVGHLENILGQENVEFEPPALRLLAQGAQGSMRDALSLTDQAIAYAAGKVTLEAVQGMLGALDQSYLIRLLDALAAKDGAGLLAVADEMAERSLSYNAALQDLGTLLHRIALAQTVPAAVPQDLPERGDILRLSSVFDAEEVQLFYQIAVHGRNELGLAPDEYAGFSMTLLRMLAFRPMDGGGDAQSASKPATPVSAPAPARTVANASAAIAVAPSRSSMPASAPQAPARSSAPMSPALAALEAARNGSRRQTAASRSQPAPAPVAVPAKAPRLADAVSKTEDLPPWVAEEMPDQNSSAAMDDSSEAAQKKTESLGQEISQETSHANPPAAERPRSVIPEPDADAPFEVRLQPLPSLDWDGNWPKLAAALPVRGVVQQLAQQSELTHCSDEGHAIEFQLRVPVDTLRSASSVDKLASTLTEHFGKTVRVNTELGAVRQTANAQALADRAALQRQAEQTIQSDPFVQSLIREFGASIVPGSIKPI